MGRNSICLTKVTVYSSFDPIPFLFPFRKSSLRPLEYSCPTSKMFLLLGPNGLYLLAKLFPAVTKK